MRDGRLAQVGDPATVYEKPASRWVADFIGEVTLIEGLLGATRTTIETRLGPLRIPGAVLKPGTEIALALRPEKLSLGGEKPEAGPEAAPRNALAGTISEIGYRGDVSLYKVQLADRSLIKVARANVSGEAPFDVGDLVWVTWAAEAGVVLRE
jgi:putrescine transport system ATP-binding protein